MQVSEAKARELLMSMGKASSDTPPDKILKRLNNIRKTIEGATDPSEEYVSLLEEILNAVDEGEEVGFASSNGIVPHEENTPKKRGRKPKVESGEKKEIGWTEDEVDVEVKKALGATQGDIAKAIEETKEYLESASAPYDKLGKLVLNALKMMEEGGEELTEEVEAKEEVVEAAKEESEKEEVSKPKKEGKPRGRGGDRDELGNIKGSQGSMINECLSKEPKSLDDIVSESNLPRARVKSHLNWLCNKKHLIVEIAEGWKIK